MSYGGNLVVAPVWLWLPSGQGEPLEADHVVWEVDESPASMSEASVTPEYVCNWSIKAMAVLPALPPQPILPTGCPLSALPSVSAAQSPPESDSPLKRHIILQA